MNLYREIAQKKEEGAAFVIATIIRKSGSSPRDVGAKMIIYPDEKISGTIGGGTFERLVIEDSLNLLKGDGNHFLKSYRFTPDGSDATGMICGGEAEVFMEVNKRAGRLIIFGGGHIGFELAKLASPLNFKITVIDDRKDILSKYERSIETLLTDPAYADNFPSIERKSYVVIVTKGHKSDQLILSRAIKNECAYIGMIGSKAKIAKVFASLKETGITQSTIDRVHAPIGLDIGAEGPYEIALAIIAEIIAAKNKTPSISK